MGDQVQHFAFTVPAGTAIATPQVSQMQLGAFQVNWVEVELPPGVNGAVGFYLASSKAYWVPTAVGASPPWVITTERVKHWDITNGPTSGDFQLVAYNVGGYPHTLQVTWDLSLVQPPGPAPITALLPASALSS